MHMYIKLQSTVDIIIRKTLNLAYFKLAVTCSSLGRPLKKKPNCALHFLRRYLCPICCNKRMEDRQNF